MKEKKKRERSEDEKEPETEPETEQPSDGRPEEPAEGPNEAGQTDGSGVSPEQAAGQPSGQAERDPLADALAAAEDYKRKWYAVTAEYENYRKRTQSESARRYAEGRSDVVSKLFPVGDNLERAFQSCENEATRKGIGMVMKAFAKILEEEHIEVIDPKGQPFDAEQHEAIMAVEAADGEESGTVKEVYAKGYRQNGRVLRFAQVVVVR